VLLRDEQRTHRLLPAASLVHAGSCPGSGLVDRAFSATAPNQLWVADIERHEALLNRAVVRGHRGWSVAAGR
jgi:hypothetical protein